MLTKAQYEKQILSIFCLCLLLSFTACTKKISLAKWKDFHENPGGIWNVNYSSQGNYFSALVDKTTILIYDKNWKKIWEDTGNIKEVGSLVFSPDESFFGVTKYQNELDIALINISDKNVFQILNGHSSWVNCLDFSSDNRFIASGSDDRSVILWKKEGRFYNYHKNFNDFEKHVSSVAFSPDCKFLASSAGSKIVIRAIKSKPMDLFQTIQINARSIHSLKFSPDSQFLACGAYDGSVSIWELNGNNFLQFRSFKDHNKMVKSIDFSPNSKYIASGSWDKTIVVRNLRGEAIANPFKIKAHSGFIFTIKFSPDGKFLASGSDDRSFIIWKTKGIF